MRDCEYLFGIDDVHDNTALEHLGQTGLDGEVGGGTVLGSHCGGVEKGVVEERKKEGEGE